MKRRFLLAAVLVSTASAPAQADVHVFTGSCDGSAIAMLGPDLFATVSDEEAMIRIFRLEGGSDIAKSRLPVGSPLGLTSDQEGDFEAAARVGDTIYWIASFGSGKDGGAEPSRRRFFATHVAADGLLSLIGTSSSRRGSGLFDALIFDPKLASYDLGHAALLPPKTANALNIEGLAADGEGGLVIGLRNPLAGTPGKALLVTLANPAQVIAGTQAPVLSRVATISLGGRGIRDLVFRPGHKDFLILAGAIDETRDFALFQWSGDPNEKPKELPNDFGDLNPEALTILEDGRLLFLSDDGEVKPIPAGKTCKKLPDAQKQFRGLISQAPD